MRFNILAALASSAIVGFLVVWHFLYPAMTDITVVWTGTEVGLFMLVLLAGGTLAMHCTFMGTLLLFAFAFGHESKFGWVPPSRCSSLGAWLAHAWSFLGEADARGNRRQSGMRYLGLEVAFEGKL